MRPTPNTQQKQRLRIDSINYVFFKLQTSSEITFIKTLTKGHTERQKRLLKNEIRILSALSHQNIIRPHLDLKKTDSVQLILTYYPLDLYNFLAKQCGFIPWITAIKICLGVSRAIHYLHSRQLAHRDIKPENIMLDDEYTPKLVDFEHSIQLPSNNSTVNNLPISGTPHFLSPELTDAVISQGGQAKLTYNVKKADMFSLGITLFYTIQATFNDEIETLFPSQKHNNVTYNDYRDYKTTCISALKPLLDHAGANAYFLILNLIDKSPGFRANTQQSIERLENTNGPSYSRCCIS